MNLFEKANECLMHTYVPLPIIITHGEGSCLFDENNKKYIDFTSGIGVSSVGYNNKKLNEAINNNKEIRIWTSHFDINSYSLFLFKNFIS